MNAMQQAIERHWDENGYAVRMDALYDLVGRPDVEAFKAELLRLWRADGADGNRLISLTPWGRHASEMTFAGLCPVVTSDRAYHMAYASPGDRSHRNH